MHSTSHLRISCHCWEWGNSHTPPSAGDVHASRSSTFLPEKTTQKKGKKIQRNEVRRLKNSLRGTWVTYCCVSHTTPVSSSRYLSVNHRQITHGGNKKRNPHLMQCRVKGLIARLDGVTVTWHFTGLAFYSTGVIRFAMKAHRTFSWIAAGLRVNASRSHPQSVSAQADCSSAGGVTAG